MSALGISHGTLRGRDKHSMDALRRFLKRKIRVLITHQQVAGHGLRFPQCRHAIYYSVDWSNDRFQQSLRRFWRPPQKRSCRVWLLMAENTVDHDIVSALEGKANWRDICRRTLRSHNRSVPSNGTGPGSERKRPPIPTHRAPATTPRVRGV